MVPRKSIFVSRLNAALTVNDVMHQIVTSLSLTDKRLLFTLYGVFMIKDWPNNRQSEIALKFKEVFFF